MHITFDPPKRHIGISQYILMAIINMEISSITQPHLRKSLLTHCGDMYITCTNFHRVLFSEGTLIHDVDVVSRERYLYFYGY